MNSPGSNVEEADAMDSPGSILEEADTLDGRGSTVVRSYRDLLKEGSLGSPEAQKLIDRTDPILAAIVRRELEAREQASRAPSPVSTRTRLPPARAEPARTETQPSDTELVRMALRASTAQERTSAFEAIADRYCLIILRQCARWFPDPEAAQDVAQDAFTVAFTLLARGKGPERPEKLGGWLIELARRGGQQRWRAAVPRTVSSESETPESFDELEDDEESRSGSAVRRAHATRLVETVVATLTGRQQEIYQLRFVQELTGKEIAERLGIHDKDASNQATIVQHLIADGFGALILSQEGRAYCPDLAKIIDSTVGPALSGAFSAVLRDRIVNHFSAGPIGDNCRICNTKRRELAAPYVP